MPTSAAPPSGHQPPPEKRSRATYEEEESKDDNASDESISRDRRGGAVEGDQRPFVSGRTSRRHVGNNTDDDNYAAHDDDADAGELSVVTIKKSTDGDDAVVMPKMMSIISAHWTADIIGIWNTTKMPDILSTAKKALMLMRRRAYHQ